MSQRVKSTMEKHRPCSFSLPPMFIEALEKHENKSQIISTLVEENLHRIGDMSVTDAEELRRERIKEVIEEEFVHALDRIKQRVIQEGIGRLDWLAGKDIPPEVCPQRGNGRK